MIYKLFKHLNKNFEILDTLQQKPTARCPFSAIVKVDNEKKYVVIATSDIQKFYLKRSIEKQKEFYQDFSPYFKFNFPDCYGDLEDIFYTIYPYIENLKWCEDERPIKIIEEIYSKHAQTYKMTPEILEKIQEDFLSSWSHEFHAEIKQLPLYKEYFEKISKENEVKIYKEHCDYTVNNILDDGKNLWLMDFEFAKSFQVVGHDLHDYKRTLAIEYLNKQNVSKLKEKMMDNTNDLLDKPKRQNPITKWLKPASSKHCRGGVETTSENQNNLKIQLIDTVNDICDRKQNSVINLISDKDKIHQVSPNFTYNRFDIRFGQNYELFEVKENNMTTYIPYHIQNDTCILGVWLTEISKLTFDNLINKIFEENDNVFQIQTRYSLNQYQGLEIFNHWRVELPATIEEFSSKLSSKTRYNTQWYPKKINEKFGKYEIKRLERAEITDDIVHKYFEFKKVTHNFDYQMTPKQYLDEFYVTHAYVMYINKNVEAVIFNCLVGEIAYIENLAFNPELSKFSLGTVLYYYLINDLINEKTKYIYLGDGNQEYKKRFNGTNQLCFDGFIKRPIEKYKIKPKRLKLAKKLKFKSKKLRKLAYKIIKTRCKENEKIF